MRATSYGADEVGTYEISVSATSVPVRSPSTPQTYGIFLGISDYDRLGYLPYTADDPNRILTGLVERAGMSRGNAVVLTDEEATLANVRAAFETMRTRVGQRDTFIFFFSGHGDRSPGQPASSPERSTWMALMNSELFDVRCGTTTSTTCERRGRG